MHIPDGLISPQTFIPAFALAIPLWYVAWRQVREVITDALLPQLAVFSALAFMLSTLMVPLPGGTAAHAIGVPLMALVLGPWLAFLGYSLVLLFQALVMGAGGITTLGLNALAMGLVGAWTTIGATRSLGFAGDTVAVIGAVWVSIMVSAGLIAIILGIQPLIAQSDEGSPLFFPFGVSVTLPAVLLPHAITAAGEAMLTLLIYRHAKRRGWIETTLS